MRGGDEAHENRLKEESRLRLTRATTATPRLLPDALVRSPARAPRYSVFRTPEVSPSYKRVRSRCAYWRRVAVTCQALHRDRRPWTDPRITHRSARTRCRC